MKLYVNKKDGLITPEKISAVKFNSLENGKYWCVLTNSAKDVRRIAQNRLYWQILTDMQNTVVNEMAGITKEDWHKRMKKDFLVNIFIRDDEGYALVWTKLENVFKECGNDVYQNIYDWILNKTSTTDANVKQFSEYLTSIIYFCHSKGVFLKIDSGVYETAMGK